MALEPRRRIGLVVLGCAWLDGASAQAPSCSLFKHGTFIIQGDHPGEETRLVRHGNKQKETAPDGHKARYRVRWIDECTYQLYDRKVTHGKDTWHLAATDTLTVQIVGTWEYGYAFRATSNFADHELMGTMEMVVPKLGGFTIGL